MRPVTKTEAELIVRELVDRYGTDPWRMSKADTDRLADAIRILGQPRVFEIAEERLRRG